MAETRLKSKLSNLNFFPFHPSVSLKVLNINTEKGKVTRMGKKIQESFYKSDGN